MRGTVLLALSMAAASLFGGEKTWNPTVQEGGLYKWSNAANWLEGGAATTAPSDGESVVFDSSSAAIAAYNDVANRQFLKVTLRGTHDITLSGEKMVACDRGGFFAENAPITVTLALPIDLGGTVFFSSTSNGVSRGATFELTGAIGDYQSLTGTFATGGDFSGVYNFRGNNTYSGVTYITNGLAYHVYSGTAFGSATGKTVYSVPTDSLFGVSNFDKYRSTIYMHGVTTDEQFDLYGRQMRDLVFLANTTNTINGSVNAPSGVERWTLQAGAKAVLNGTVAFHDVCQLNVEAGGELYFSNKVSNITTIRSAAKAASGSLPMGRIVYAGDIELQNKGTVQTLDLYAAGEAAILKNDAFGAYPPHIAAESAAHGGHFVFGGARQRIRSFRDAASVAVISSEGTVLEVTNADSSNASYGSSPLRDSLSLVVSGGTQTLRSVLSNTKGELVATNGGVIAISSGETFPNAAAVRVYSGSKVTVPATATFRDSLSVALDGTGRLELASGVVQVVGILMTNGVEAARGLTYGATGSGADVIDDVHFAGTGKLSLTGMRDIELTWVGPASGGDLAQAANWSPALTPSAGERLVITAAAGAVFTNSRAGAEIGGLSVSCPGAVTLSGEAFGLVNGATVSASGGGTFTDGCAHALSGSATILFTAASGTKLVLNGVLSGSAAVKFAGAGEISVAGANTFTGECEVNAHAFRVMNDKAFGTTDGKTTLRRPDTGANVYFSNVTVDDAIDNYSDGSGAYWILSGNVTFNGALARKSEQIRISVQSGAHVTFNADFPGDLSYFTADTGSSGSTVEFNCSFSGYPRFSGPVSVIYRKTVTYSPRSSSYSFFHSQNAGTRYLHVPYAFGRGTSTPVIDAAIGGTQTIDCLGNDQEVASLERNSFDLTSSTGPATMYVLNNATQGGGDTYKGSVKGELSVVFSAGSARSAVTLTGESTSSGALVATNGCTVTLASGAVWAGAVDVAASSAVALSGTGRFGTEATVNVQTGGTLTLGAGEFQVAELTLGGVVCESGRTYGAAGSGADVEITDGTLAGSGKFRVVTPEKPIEGVTRTWAGPLNGRWSEAANWNPAGTPGVNDVLVFEATSAIASENDIAELTLLGLEIAGNSQVTLSGGAVTLADGGAIRAVQSAAEVTLALPVTLAAGNQSITATSNSTGHATWRLTGGFSGTGSLHFGGDHSAEVHFLADSPDYAGELFLTNAAAYHVWTDGAFGSTAGASNYGVAQGDLNVNIERFVEPLYFHGITTAEPIRTGANASFGLCFANGTTNVFNGPIDVYTGIRYLNNCPIDRLWVGTNAMVKFNGDVGMRQIPGDSMAFNHFIPYAQPGAAVIVNGRIAASGVRARGVGNAFYELNNVVGAETSYFGNYANGTIYFGCTNALVASGTKTARFMFGYHGYNLIDLNGYDQTLRELDYANADTNAMSYARFASMAAPAVLRLEAPYDVRWTALCQNQLSLTLASPHLYTLEATNSASGVLLVTGGATATFAGSGRWMGDVSVAADGALRLAAPALGAAVHLAVAAGGTVQLGEGTVQHVASLALGGVAQAEYRTYGSSASAADVKNDAYFSGTGVVSVMPAISGVERTWKGGAGSWSVAANWEPAGAPQSGDTLVFDSNAGAVAAANDLEGLVLLGIVARGGNAVAITGNAFTLLDSAGITVRAGTAATISAEVATLYLQAGNAVALVAEAGASLLLEGVLSGTANIRASGAGCVGLKGANTFSGQLSVSSFEFDAWGASPFGTAAGKTEFFVPDDGEPQYRFHGIVTEDQVEWGQSNGRFCGFFDSVNVFKGVFKGTRAQPRWTIYANASVVMSNEVSGVGSFTVNTYAGAVLDLVHGMSGSQLRFQGKGDAYIREPMTLTGMDYAIAFSADTAKHIHFLAPDVLGVRDSDRPKMGASVLGIEGGTVDLHGNDQHASVFYGHENGTLTSTEGPATLHVLQTMRGCLTPGTTTVFDGVYNGVVTGPVTLSVEGNPNPVGAYPTSTVNMLIPTQKLTGVSISTGALVATNSAVIAFLNGGSWAGTNIVVHAASKIRLSATGGLSRDANVYLENDGTASSGRLVLDEGVAQRCRWLYVNGVRQPRGRYGSGEAGSPEVKFTRADLFEGRGVFTAAGDVGLSINFR